MRKYRVVALFIFGFLSYLFWGTGLTFTFWRDDWYYLWNAIYSPIGLLKFSLHPGTVAEFFLLAKLFGQHVIFWQHFGILLRAAAAVSVMEMTTILTASTATGWIAGILFVTTPLGLESVNWPAAHIANLEVLLFCEGMAAYGKYVDHRKKSLIKALLFFGGAILADPLRMLSLIWVPLAYTMKPFKRLVQLESYRFIRTVLGACLSIGILLTTPYWFPWFNSRLDLVRTHPTRFGIVFNYWNALWNLLTGWAVPIHHTVGEIGNSVFNAPSAIAGFIVFCIAIGLLVWYRKARHTRQYRSLFIAALWSITTIGVQWAIDPRLIPATAHRYFVLPSVGLILLLAWVMNFLPRQYKIIVLALLLGFAWQTRGIVLGEMMVFRDGSVEQHIWQTIDSVVTTQDIPPVIITMGEDPVKTNVVDIDADWHFMLKRANRGIRQTAIFTTDTAVITRLLCGTGRAGSRKYKLDDVYAFTILNNGTVRDDTKSFHSYLTSILGVRHCLAETK